MALFHVTGLSGTGKAPEELAAILRWHADYEAAYRRFGAVIIDAARPLRDVVDEILTTSVQPSSRSG